MTTAMQLFAIFAFGLVITGIVFLGILRAKEESEKVRSAASGEEPQR